MRYRKKPVVIEAVRFVQGMDVTEPRWLGDAISENVVITHGLGKFARGEVYATIKTLEGDHRCNEGDYIIRGVKGELYPCKPDIFEATYEPVE
ncbi:PGDYG domain-containing protein [Halomonas sp. McH1-25]|uniref:PGDYG domain-containing protein n=1 Tax=unclassified Halomonas TaxID=2609666 RepID=UPI001EF47B86|nr:MULTISPECIES: PGDYG domain-containing protein [unclassified Halomonas]MCG7598878.1 PGDYG domain-containing protein [Halomonas sp. McH1-25]MCP1340841.1 PGDYG domain-containing protein [Halomonas sp. FL8]MCP1361276.1 PGDYG domain-containing protein [Halomonas sp. BBD45]MCP1363697.1 PGDYG domain-containing protein [Halomonas sp. BBD48]